ncbi:hypothetical protein EK904_008443 [Melospiza melodia maxima]|nr:hypothetical protein EK904_008443 [Melospiza melodia maxima]
MNAGASPLHECSERPEDWCRDAATAAKCGALELCQLTAWDRALGKGIPCHLCQVAVSVVGKILQDNRTEEKLRLFLDKRCQYLPFQDWSVKCKRMVDTGILVLVQLGKQVLLARAVREALGTDSAFSWALVAHAKRLCQALPPVLALQCQRSLAEYTDTAAQLLHYLDPSELCGQLGLCASSSALPLHTLLTERLMQLLSLLGVSGDPPMPLGSLESKRPKGGT